MNVLATLEEELKGKNWDKGTKARYLYLRCCEIFSFDSRSDYYTYLEPWEDRMEAKLRIREKKIDLRNVLDRRIMCSNYLEDAYSKLMEELLGIWCIPNGIGHVWPEFLEPEEERYLIKADATKSDLTRVKMRLKTHGYHPVNKCFRSDFESKLEKIDGIIGYREGEYTDEKLKRQAKRYFQNRLQNNSLKEERFLLDIMCEVKKVFDSYENFSVYFDASWCIDYLRDIYFGQSYYPNEKNINLFQFRENFEVDLVDLYPIQVGDDKAYFILEKREASYSFYEIEEREAKQYRKEMQCTDKNIVL